MTEFWVFSAIVVFAFCLGYGLRWWNLRWEEEARQASDEAQIKSEQLQATVTASLDGIIIINLSGEVVEFSESAERIFGYRKVDVLGKNMADLIVPERYRDAHNAGMERMRNTGEGKILGQRIEIEAMRSNGEEFMSELAISRSRDHHGDIFIAYIRDISEKKAAEKLLVQAKEAAEEASRVKTRFLATMSHEIRTPFNAVLGILDILGETELNEDQIELVKTAETSSLALLRVINDVLDYSRITSGTYTLNETAFAAESAFDDIIQLFKPQATDKGLKISLDTSGAGEVHLLGDFGRIRQVLMNFVGNAIKFTDDGMLNLSVATEDLGADRYMLTCAVTDTGIGIAPYVIDQLFDPFYMIDDSDARAQGGTGLGLTISKTIAELLGGQVEVESQLGEGSTFRVHIPLAKAEPAQLESRFKDISKDIKDSRILLAEDNTTNQMVVSRLLENCGAILTIANNGEEAIEALKKQAFDVVLMDIFMPVMGGKEATRLIRETDQPYRDIPIIALTAMGNLHELNDLKTIGMNDVVTKPFKRSDLLSSIKLQIGGESMDSEISSNTARQALYDLLGDISEDELDTLKFHFANDLSNAADELEIALSNKNIQDAIRPSHTLKGLTATYGLEDLSEIAALTNSHCHSGNLPEAEKEGMRTIELVRQSLKNIDRLFAKTEEAA